MPCNAIMPEDYNPVAATESGSSDANIASFDLEIASNRQRNESASGVGRNWILWIFFSSVAVAGYCMYTGIIDLPSRLVGAPVDDSDVDSPTQNEVAGWSGDDLGYDEHESTLSNVTPEESNQEQDTSQQQIINDGNQEAKQEAIAEAHHDQQLPSDDSPKIIFCYGDSLTEGFTLGHGEEPHPYGPSLQSELNYLYSSAETAIGTLMSASATATVVETLGFPGMPASVMAELVEQEQVGTCYVIEQITDISVMIILAGTNDIHGRIDSNSAETILESLTSLHDKTLECAKREGNNYFHILSLGIPQVEFQAGNPLAAEVATKVNEGLNARYNIQNPHGNIVYRDFPIAYNQSDSKWSPDGVHLTALGYDELGKQLAPEVKSILDSMFS